MTLLALLILPLALANALDEDAAADCPFLPVDDSFSIKASFSTSCSSFTVVDDGETSRHRMVAAVNNVQTTELVTAPLGKTLSTFLQTAAGNNSMQFELKDCKGAVEAVVRRTGLPTLPSNSLDILDNKGVRVGFVAFPRQGPLLSVFACTPNISDWAARDANCTSGSGRLLVAEIARPLLQYFFKTLEVSMYAERPAELKVLDASSTITVGSHTGPHASLWRNDSFRQSPLGICSDARLLTHLTLQAAGKEGGAESVSLREGAGWCSDVHSFFLALILLSALGLSAATCFACPQGKACQSSRAGKLAEDAVLMLVCTCPASCCCRGRKERRRGEGSGGAAATGRRG